jgi:hypothetical protein
MKETVNGYPVPELVYSTPQTGVTMNSTAGTVITNSGSPLTMVASPVTGTYQIDFEVIPTAAGTGTGCNAGAVAVSLGFKDADTGVAITTGTGGPANENVPFTTLAGNTLSLTIGYTTGTVGAPSSIYSGLVRTIRVASGTPITYQVWQVTGSNCGTSNPVISVRPSVWYLGY